jgi:hypothetical protein
VKHVCDCDSPEVLVRVGPLVEVTFLPHSSVRDSFVASGDMPQTTVKMLVDTGADRTVVERRIAEGMGLSPIRFHPMVGVNQKPELYPVFLISLQFCVEDDHGKVHTHFDAEVIGMNPPPVSKPYAGLIGRDFLRHFHVIYNGPKGKVELHLSSGVAKNAAKKLPKKHHRR